MSDRNESVESVASGVPYHVEQVNGHHPRLMEDFVEEPVNSITAESGEQTIEIQGPGRRDDDTVVIYEKDQQGEGRDMRTWSVTDDEGGFEVTERAIF